MCYIITSKTRRTKNYLAGCGGADFRPAQSQEALCRRWEETGYIKGREAAWWKTVIENWKERDENLRHGLSEDGKMSLSEATRFDEINVDGNGRVYDRDGNPTDLQAEPVRDAENSVPWPIQGEDNERTKTG